MAGNRRRAFTLIETVMAIVILAVAVPPMLWAVREAHRSRANPVMASTARWLAVEKLEDMIADRHSTDPNPPFGYANLTGGTENPVSGYAGYVRTTSVSEHGAWDNVGQTWSAGTGYKTVTVAVQWTNADGDSQTVSISTVVTDYTP